jgi:DNA-binding NarL/FixJ family response regulator
MADYSGLLEKEKASFSTEQASMPKNQFETSQTRAKNTSESENDDVLEGTLFNYNIDASLTKREKEILTLIVVGNTNKEISRKINRSERTVEYHLHRLMGKLDAKTAADLVKRSIVMGIA